MQQNPRKHLLAGNRAALRSAVVGAWAILLSACSSPEPTEGFSAIFIRHLRANSPADIRDCIEEKARLRWKNQYQIYGEANQIRMSRGETDVVNYAVGRLIPSCRPGRPQLPPFRESNRSAPSDS